MMATDVKITADSNTFPMEEYEPAQEIFIDGMAAYTVTAGVVKINCFSIYVDHEGNTKRKIVLRLTVPIPLVSAMHIYLGQMKDVLKKSGVLMEVPNVTQ